MHSLVLSLVYLNAGNFVKKKKVWGGGRLMTVGSKF